MEQESDEPKESGDEGLEACAQDMINCIHSKDAKGVAAAMRSAFEILESRPHKEGEHLEEDYDSQNIKAAKEQG